MRPLIMQYFPTEGSIFLYMSKAELFTNVTELLILIFNPVEKKF